MLRDPFYFLSWGSGKSRLSCYCVSGSQFAAYVRIRGATDVTNPFQRQPISRETMLRLAKFDVRPRAFRALVLKPRSPPPPPPVALTADEVEDYFHEQIGARIIDLMVSARPSHSFPLGDMQTVIRHARDLTTFLQSHLDRGFDRYIGAALVAALMPMGQIYGCGFYPTPAYCFVANIIHDLIANYGVDLYVSTDETMSGMALPS